LLVSSGSWAEACGMPSSMTNHICQDPSSHDNMPEMHSSFLFDRFPVPAVRQMQWLSVNPTTVLATADHYACSPEASTCAAVQCKSTAKAAMLYF
jgi:hypothetical protein